MMREEEMQALQRILEEAETMTKAMVAKIEEMLQEVAQFKYVDKQTAVFLIYRVFHTNLHEAM